jgi:hypothetical protein
MARARIPEFESYHPSQAVRSLRCDFRVCENRRHSGGLGRLARVSVPQFPDFRPKTGGIRTPVSAGHFPISVSACPRPVRYVTETGSRESHCQRRARRCDNRQEQDNRREGCRSGPSDSHHDLPELSVLLEIAVHIRHLVEGEGAIDDRFESAGL